VFFVCDSEEDFQRNNTANPALRPYLRVFFAGSMTITNPSSTHELKMLRDAR
jgi:hypothetical protein